MPPGQILPIDPQQPVGKPAEGTGHTTRRMAVDAVLPLPGQPRRRPDPRAASSDERRVSDEQQLDRGASAELTGSSRRLRRIGDYELRRELARGGMGVVYEGYHAALGRAVAIKLLKGGHQASSEEVQRFQLEAKAVARLNHPNIVAVHQVGEEQGYHYLVMDLVEGDTLHHRLERFGALEPLLAARVVRDLALALDHAHTQGILHRDVKPANVLLTRDGRPRLTDFGLAKVEDSKLVLTLTGEVVGTPAYMSPEQARGLEIDERTDVYALGCVMYQTLTGQAPFPGENPVEVMHAVVNELPPRPSAARAGVPAELDAICWRCLDKDPARRFQTARELADALSRVLVVKEQPRPPAPASRRPLWIALSLVFGGLLLALTMLVALPRRGQSEPAAPSADAGSILDQAQAQLDRGETARAMELTGAALDANTTPAERLRAAQLLRQAGALERAAALLQEVARAGAPQSPQALLLARELELQIDPTRIDELGALQPALTDAQAQADAPLRLLADAESHRLDGRADEAAAAYRQALALAPDLALAQLGLALVLDAEQPATRAEALQACDRAVDLAPDLVPAHLLRLRLLLDSGDLEGAEQRASQLVEAQPQLAAAWLARGRVRYRLQDLKGALEDDERALKLNADDPGAYTQRARHLNAARQFPRALQDYDRAIELSDPVPARLHAARGRLRLRTRDLKGAEEDATAALGLNPKHAGAHALRGQLRLLRGDVEGALEDLDAALEAERSPQRRVDDYLQRSQIHMHMGHRTLAVEDLQRAKAELPADDPRAQPIEAYLLKLSR